MLHPHPPSSCPFSRHPHLASTTDSGWRQTAPHSGHGRAPMRRRETPTRHSASCNLFMSLLRSKGSFSSPSKTGSSCHKTPSLASALHTKTHICTHTPSRGICRDGGPSPHTLMLCRLWEGISQAEKEEREKSGGQDGCVPPPTVPGRANPCHIPGCVPRTNHSCQMPRLPVARLWEVLGAPRTVESGCPGWKLRVASPQVQAGAMGWGSGATHSPPVFSRGDGWAREGLSPGRGA